MPATSGDLLLPVPTGDTERDRPGDTTTGGFRAVRLAGSGTTKPSRSVERTESREDSSPLGTPPMEASLRISPSSDSESLLSLDSALFISLSLLITTPLLSLLLSLIILSLMPLSLLLTAPLLSLLLPLTISLSLVTLTLPLLQLLTLLGKSAQLFKLTESEFGASEQLEFELTESEFGASGELEFKARPANTL